MIDSRHVDLTEARRWLPVTVTLSGILRRTLEEHPNDQCSDGVTLNFRDPNYSVEHGGYHPVEIRLERSDSASGWRLVYITDFAFFGPVYPELEKELDFNLSNGTGYQAYTGEYPLNHFRGLYRIWESNFRYYLGLGVYQLTVTWD
ncbi:DUF2787 domain-containing protein [Shewanella indica]|uniref:DUF2787 domain-containing protein n=1 Tax=Shewanella TaxID=22 RepID=UPI00399C3459